MGKKDLLIVSNSYSLLISPPWRRSLTRGWRTSLAAIATMAAVMVFAGCGPGIQHTTLPNATVRATGQTEMAQDGLTVSVQPITWESAAQFPQIFRSYQRQTTRQRMMANGSLTPLPAFAITVTNETGHVVRFSQSVIRLSDEDGNEYEAMDRDQLAAWAHSAWAPVISFDPSFEEVLTTDVHELRLFDHSVEMLNHDHRTYFLVLDLGPSTIETQLTAYQHLLANVDRLTVRIAEVPVELGDAGQVTRTTEFEFNFDRGQYDQTVACRGGHPSWDTCQRE